MPIYEYRCQACGHTLDWLQKVSDPPLSKCPSCNEPALKRLISAPSFRLKGGGWYETDFKSDKDKRRNLAETAGGDSGAKASTDGKSTDGKSTDGKSKADDKPKSSDQKTTKKGETSNAKPDKKAGKGSEAA
ncbi:MAG TPA: zinc ribbon domain-containing protein [Gammaproteobacteria bacterium]|nr:zinc ribbon domain-containing protein [Gammaproteobacteria bacterium]